jgi:hypothetical protein
MSSNPHRHSRAQDKRPSGGASEMARVAPNLHHTGNRRPKRTEHRWGDAVINIRPRVMSNTKRYVYWIR